MSKNDLIVAHPQISGIYRPGALEAMDKSIDRLQRTIDEVVAQVDPLTIECKTANDLHKLSNAMTGLVNARTAIARLELEGQNMIKVAGEQIKREMTALIGDDSELVRKIRETAARAEARLCGDE